MSSLADVIITVTKFTPNSSTIHPSRDASLQLCEIDAKLGLSIRGRTVQSERWKVDETRQIFICPPPDDGTIAIRKQPDKPALEFNITIASGNGVPALRPTEIVFEQQKFKNDPNRPLNDTNGSANFDLLGSSGNQLTVLANWRDKGHSKDRSPEKHAAPFWKFWIRVETTDANGRTENGWIDPTIENSDDMQGIDDPENPPP